MLIITAAAILLAATPVQVTYLECAFPNNDAVLDVTADEANSAVTLVLRSTGAVDKFGAAFTPTEVRFENKLLSHTISRTDLSIQRTLKLVGSTSKGTCKVVPAPIRAF